MGNACCGKKKEKKTIVLLLVGLDNAGKTVAAKGLAGEPITDVVPTVGFHTVKVGYKDFIVKVYDLGGAANFRGIWHKYFVDAYGIIFVIDSSDLDRLDEAKHVLKSVLSHEKVSGKPVLFLANKQDNENALDEIDLHEKLNLEDIVNTYQCPTLVECCSATDSKSKTKIDSGIRNGFNWLMSYIEKNYNGLNTRVVVDTSQQEQLDKKLRDEIIKRIQEARKIEDTQDEDAIELYSEYTKKLNIGSGNIPNGHCVKDSIETNDESDEDPPLYYGTAIKRQVERPKSAREFVKEQLRLNCNGVSHKKNKTLPMYLLGIQLPHSARERSRTCEMPKRILKSAGDVKRTYHLPNMVFPETGDDFQQGIELRNFTETSSFLPLDLSPKVKIRNGISKFENCNEISFINIS